MKNHKKIRFSGAGESYQCGAAEGDTNAVVTMEKTMLMHADLICPDDTFSIDIWPMSMDYAIWVYNQISDIQSG